LSELLEGVPGRIETEPVSETGGSRAQPDCHKKVARSSLWIQKIDLTSYALFRKTPLLAAEWKICDHITQMIIKKISSLQHPLVRHFVKLRDDRGYRYQCQKVVVSGFKLVQELSLLFHFRTLFLERESAPPFEVRADDIYHVSRQILKKITGLETPEPIAAEIGMLAPPDLSSATTLLILDGVSDPGNLGTLLRTAKGLGWDAAWMTPGSTDPYNEKAVRAAKGATFTLPWKSGSWEELDLFLSERRMTLLAADASGEEIESLSASLPLALALGNEARGLTPRLKEAARLVAVPMEGRTESLNVAAAGSILLYALNQKSKAPV
jgi:TrmH family RNA methyltransferase